ncbi:tetratricopeptide repeat protein [Microlunatus antarcticus]|uniref:Tetratricopeptide (TPR) repeat protein n=1 Tax=Microlunatus antarcticus TaxID=53388 RepID=A0A7W5P685_9ACTN|nr:tetratricopeptide (TPR) repeat protein [Microlunatus antarcticus]
MPEGVDLSTLHRAVRAELRSLPKELEQIVAGHLVAAGNLIDTDPELAYAHAEAARRRAARLPVVREAAAETAYASGEWAAALSEFRALRRMTGSSDYLPVMADCERALGRPQNALTLAREAAELDLEPALRTEMTIVAAGARADLGQKAEAVRMLREAVTGPAPKRTGPALTRGAAAQAVELEHQAAARLRYAYADALLETGSAEEARRMFAEAAKRDPDQLTDALQRLEELDGVTLDVGDLDDSDLVDDEPEDDEPEPDDDNARDDDDADEGDDDEGDDEQVDDEPGDEPGDELESDDEARAEDDDAPGPADEAEPERD